MGIVRGHKGSLRAFSRPGQGATIQLLFPVVQAQPEEAAVLSSGYSETEILQKMAGARPTDFLQKPYRLDYVLRLFEKYL